MNRLSIICAHLYQLYMHAGTASATRDSMFVIYLVCVRWITLNCSDYRGTSRVPITRRFNADADADADCFPQSVISQAPTHQSRLHSPAYHGIHIHACIYVSTKFLTKGVTPNSPQNLDHPPSFYLLQFIDRSIVWLLNSILNKISKKKTLYY